MLHGGQSEIVFAFEVMEETALGHTGFGAHILDARRIVTLGPDDFDRRVEKLLFGPMLLHGAPYR